MGDASSRPGVVRLCAVADDPAEPAVLSVAAGFPLRHSAPANRFHLVRMALPHGTAGPICPGQNRLDGFLCEISGQHPQNAACDPRRIREARLSSPVPRHKGADRRLHCDASRCIFLRASRLVCVLPYPGTT